MIDLNNRTNFHYTVLGNIYTLHYDSLFSSRKYMLSKLYNNYFYHKNKIIDSNFIVYEKDVFISRNKLTENKTIEFNGMCGNFYDIDYELRVELISIGTNLIYKYNGQTFYVKDTKGFHKGKPISQFVYCKESDRYYTNFGYVTHILDLENNTLYLTSDNHIEVVQKYNENNIDILNNNIVIKNKKIYKTDLEDLYKLSDKEYNKLINYIKSEGEQW